MKRNIFYFIAVALLAGAVTVFVSCESNTEKVTDELDKMVESLDSLENTLDNVVDEIDTTVVEDVVDSATVEENTEAETE
ncbi:MAG: hypothetical protein Kow0068_06740 [Marinilabiliales bacterium]